MNRCAPPLTRSQGPNLHGLLICRGCRYGLFVKSPTDLALVSRARGLKVTPQRQLLFTLLEGDTSHPTADSLYARASAQMPGFSLRTVYTDLTDLVDMGELQAVTLGSGAMRFDPDVDDHHHGVCDAGGADAACDACGQPSN